MTSNASFRDAVERYLDRCDRGECDCNADTGEPRTFGGACREWLRYGEQASDEVDASGIRVLTAPVDLLPQPLDGPVAPWERRGRRTS